MIPVDRRSFLVGSGLTFAGAALAPKVFADAATGPDLWAEVRSHFALRPDLVNLSMFYLASHPRPVREAIARYRERLDGDPYGTVEEACFEKDATNLGLRVKEAAARYLGGSPADVALTQSTTMGLAWVYLGLPLAAGDEIVSTHHDHYVHHEAARLAALRNGATLRKIALYDRFEDLPGITIETIVERYRRAVTPKTKVVGITWVHSSSGLRIPLKAIADAVHAVSPKALVVVDGVHGLGAVDETVVASGVDVFVAGTHKWMFGPRGTGIVWAKPEVWADMRPAMPTFDSLEVFEAWQEERAPKPPARASWFTPGGFHAFEHEWAVADAFAYHESIGRKRIADRIHELNSRLKEGLSGVAHVTLWTPKGRELSAGLVGFDVAGLAPDVAAKKLVAKGIVASSSPYARSVVRLSAGIMNTPEEIDRALAAVRELAA